MPLTYVLLHSPLVGPLTWRLVADEIRQYGLNVVLPVLRDSPQPGEPFWQQHSHSVAQALTRVSRDTLVSLVAHSGAGPLLPAIRQSIALPIHAYVFVDAGIPRDGLSRLDLMKSEDPAWAAELQRELERGGRFPDWSMDDLQEIIPDERLRSQMVAQIHPRGLDFFTEPIPVFREWPDAPCAYIQFSASYERPAALAREAGWRTYSLEAGHFHMLVDPRAVANMIIKAVTQPS